jgi:integrase/recombinase XerD
MSTADLVEKYISFKKAEGSSKRTIESYHGKLGAFANHFPTLPLDPDQIAEFLGQLKVDQLTRWDYRKHIIAFYHWLEKRQLIAIITPSFPRVKVPRKVRRVLSEDEVTNLFSHAQNFQEKAILTLLVDSKIRASELCSLTRENLFLDHIVISGKTGQRQAPISPLTYNMLTNLTSNGLLFTVEGKPFNKDSLRDLIKGIMHRAGLEGKKLGPHILRHSASVMHIMHGGDLLSLKEELGHTTTRMTEQYARLAFPEVKQKHQEVNVIGYVASKFELIRAVCLDCGLEIRVDPKDIAETSCLRCGQTGKWSMPGVKPEEMAEVSQ